jgi:release factor glutamine methyltransferase
VSRLDHDAVTRRLIAAGCVAAAEEAAELLAAAPDPMTLADWVVQREAGTPLPWIVGATTFAGRRLLIGPGVYVPRAQTEALAARAATLLPPGGRALDLCTGCGAVAAHLAATVEGARVVGIDLDPLTASFARRNGVPVIVADLAAPVRGRFDVVTAVPPYVPTGALHLLSTDVVRHEPRRALDGGSDGLDLARRVVTAAARLLRPRGWVLIELGGDQDTALRPDLAPSFDVIEPWYDDDGDLRGLAARRRSFRSGSWSHAQPGSGQTRGGLSGR